MIHYIYDENTEEMRPMTQEEFAKFQETLQEFFRDE